MSLLSTITSGLTKSGLRIIISGQEKIGKTTLSCGAPDALLIPCEVGFASIGIPKTQMIQSFDELNHLIEEITTKAQQGDFQFKTLVFDSVTAIERHIHDYVLRSDPAYKPGKKALTMDSCMGGYGKAYTIANDYFNNFLQQLDNLAVYAGINIVMTTHVFSSKIIDPTAGEYDSWDILLHSPKNSKTYGKREIITQWADVIGFLYEPIFVSQANEKAISKGVSQNKGRVIGLSRTPSYTAGNRFGMIGEIPIPAPPASGWNALAQNLQLVCGVDIFNKAIT